MLMMLFVAGLAEGTVATDADDAVPAGVLMWKLSQLMLMMLSMAGASVWKPARLMFMMRCLRVSIC